MSNIESSSERYEIPFEIRSGYRWTRHLLFIVMITIFVGIILLPFDKDVSSKGIKVIISVIGTLITYSWIYIGVLRKGNLELTQYGVCYKMGFGRKSVEWSEIHDIQTYTMNHNLMIGIVLREKILKQKNTLFQTMGVALGGSFSISIPCSMFPGLNVEKLYMTMFYKIKENFKELTSEEENLLEERINEEKQRPNNVGVALIKVAIVALISGVLYGLSIYFLKVNILIIPLLGLIAIIFTYIRNYSEPRYNLVYRLILAIIGAAHVFVGPLTVAFIRGRYYEKAHGLIDLITDYYQLLLNSPGEQISFIFISAIWFLYGIFFGLSFKFVRKFKKIFMKKYGSYYYKKEGRYLKIYMIDPAEYEEELQKSIIEIDPNSCLIEKNGKKICAFYIKSNIIDESRTVINGMGRERYNNESYYKVDLGGSGTREVYGYSALLICDLDTKLETLNLEMD